MKQTVSEYQFIDGFSIRPNSFSYEGLQALFEWLMQLEEDTGTEMEFDPIALCCEFTQWEDLEEFQSEYGEEYDMDGIEEVTILIPIDEDSFITQDF